MKNFVFGIIATMGALVIGNKIYNKGYNEAKTEIKKDGKSSNSKKAK